MKKFLSYLSSLGIICVLTAIVWVLIAKGNLWVARFAPTRYLALIGIIIQFPYSCYKMWHWEEYEKENRVNAVAGHVCLAALIIFLWAFLEMKVL
ncbi:MAG: hypothetical protein IJ826_02615 [Bacteroidaceae bacterium]|nr:hypothetical protein [Bacteroidaceae bacterium]